jgi:hypothetical protein
MAFEQFAHEYLGNAMRQTKDEPEMENDSVLMQKPYYGSLHDRTSQNREDGHHFERSISDWNRR